MPRNLIFREKKYLQKIKIVLAKNKKRTCKCKKVLVFYLWNFRFSLSKNTPQALQVHDRRSKMAAQTKLLKNMPKHWFFRRKGLAKMKIVLAKIRKVLANAKKYLFSLSGFRFFSLKTRRRRIFWKMYLKKWFSIRKISCKN